MIIHVPKKWSKLDVLQSVEDKGRPVGAVKGSYLDDLMALQKAVILCSGCAAPLLRSAHKFGYAESVNPGLKVVRGRCDLCREFYNDCKLFLHESLNQREKVQSRQAPVRRLVVSTK